MDFEGSVGLAGERVVSRQSKHISSATTAGQRGGGGGRDGGKWLKVVANGQTIALFKCCCFFQL